jgi:rhamnose utilization protein RhaD (predicted bifunctional aldolase and dehydrogenase)
VDALLVKGSGTDLRTIGRDGFTRLSLPRLAPLRDATRMSDAEMMKFMAGCMLADGPAPSVETPLHSLLPYRVIAHTHDVATMSLTNVSDATAERLVGELFEGKIVYVPYTRPGFPLAQSVSGMAGRIPSNAIGMTLAHHGLVIFGDDVRQCYDRMLQAVAKIEDYLAASRRGRQILGAATRAIPPENERLRLAETVLPAVRGALGSAERVILHFDGAGEMLATLAHERVPELVRRGMATPEHLLRAGRLPLWLDLEPSASPDVLVREVQSQIAAQQSEYEAYHARHAAAGEKPLDDWAKVILAPGLGVITAFSDKKNAVTANLCYRATLEAITNAEAIGGFQFIPEADVFEFEHWPLERRKIQETLAKERALPQKARTWWWRIWTKESRAGSRRKSRRASPPASSGSPWTCVTTAVSMPSFAARCSNSAGSTACSTPLARRPASRRSPRSDGRICSASSKCTTSARYRPSAGPRR